MSETTAATPPSKGELDTLRHFLVAKDEEGAQLTASEHLTLRLTNYLPRLETERDEARRDVLHYGYHSGDCTEIHRPHMHKGVDCEKSHPCDCGWWDKKKALTAALAPTEGGGG